MSRKLLLFAISAIVMLYLNACGGTPGGNNGGENGSLDKSIPTVSISGRNNTKFSDIRYSTPSSAQAVESINEALSKIDENDTSYSDQLTALRRAKEEYHRFISMFSYTKIKLSLNSKNQHFKNEYLKMLGEYHSVKESYEELLSAAAVSKHCADFEKDELGEGALNGYKSLQGLSEKAVELLEDEEELIFKYSDLSEDNVFITHAGYYASYRDTCKRLQEEYKNDPDRLNSELELVGTKYQARREELAFDIYVELLKVRKNLATELGYDGYEEYAYQSLGYSYSPSEMLTLVDNIEAFALSIGDELNEVFRKFFYSTTPGSLNAKTCFESLYSVYSSINKELATVFSYMYTRELYSVNAKEDGRYSGAYTLYIPTYDAPFLFVTTSGDITDYLTLAGRFGSFVQMYHTGSSASMESSHFAGPGLALITLSALENLVPLEDYKHLLYSEYSAALYSVIYQGFTASLEHSLYGMDYKDISKESVMSIIEEIATKFGITDRSAFSLVSKGMISNPFDDQSSCISTLSALELYFISRDSLHESIDIYFELINLGGGDYFEELDLRGLSDPFDPEFLKSVMNEIYFEIKGYHYYKDGDSVGAV